LAGMEAEDADEAGGGAGEEQQRSPLHGLYS
jgi:hypothetical protein